MQITDYKLVDDLELEHYTASKHIGREIVPKYVVMHATATLPSFEKNVAAMSSDNYNAAVHLLIGREGEFHQFVPFNRAGAHSGANHWDDVYRNMDAHSIAIEMINTGPLKPDGEGGYYKKGYLETLTVPEEDRVFEAGQWWQIFPQTQLDAALSIVKLLFQAYPTLKDVLRHSEVNTSGQRQFCPGAAFPMQWFHAQVLGLDEKTPIKMVQVTQKYSRLYQGPDASSGFVGEGLPRNIRLGVLREEDGWSFVHVIEYPDNNPLLTGWIQSDRIKPDTNRPRHYHQPAEIIIPGN